MVGPLPLRTITPNNPYLWVVVLRGNCPINRGNCPINRGNCPQGNCPTGVMVLGGSCPGGNCPQGSCPMGAMSYGVVVSGVVVPRVVVLGVVVPGVVVLEPNPAISAHAVFPQSGHIRPCSISPIRPYPPGKTAIFQNKIPNRTIRKVKTAYRVPIYHFKAHAKEII